MSLQKSQGGYINYTKNVDKFSDGNDNIKISKNMLKPIISLAPITQLLNVFK